MADTEATETIVLNAENIARIFAPEGEQRHGLDAAVRMFGAHKFGEGEKAGIERAVAILKNNPLPVACFRLAEILAEAE